MQSGSLIEAHRGGPASQAVKEGPLPCSISGHASSGFQCGSAQPHPASEPASTPYQAAADKGKARWGGKRQKAKQVATPTAVQQQALPQLQTAADVPSAARQTHPAVVSGDAADASGALKLGRAQVPQQLPQQLPEAVPKKSEYASALPPVVSSLTSLLPTDLDTALPSPRHLPSASQEVSDSQPGASAHQQCSAEFPQYELFSSPSGQCCLCPSSLTPWLQMQLTPDGHDSLQTPASTLCNGVASGPARPVMRIAAGMQLVLSDVPKSPHSLHARHVSSEHQPAGQHAATSGHPFLHREVASQHALQGQTAVVGQNAATGQHAVLEQHATMGQHAKVGQHAVKGQNAVVGQNAVIGQQAMQPRAPQRVQTRPGLQQAQAMPFHSANAASPDSVFIQIQQACNRSSRGYQGGQGHLRHHRRSPPQPTVHHGERHRMPAALPEQFATGHMAPAHPSSPLQQHYPHELSAHQAQPMQVPWGPGGHFNMLPGGGEGSFGMLPGYHEQNEAGRQYFQVPAGVVHFIQARDYGCPAQYTLVCSHSSSPSSSPPLLFFTSSSRPPPPPLFYLLFPAPSPSYSPCPPSSFPPSSFPPPLPTDPP